MNILSKNEFIEFKKIFCIRFRSIFDLYFNITSHIYGIVFRHYSFAYTNLLDIQITETNLNEIKFVAFLITYKLCKINFALTQPRDAISQFNAHIDKFRGKTGSSELIFEHFAWLSKQ